MIGVSALPGLAFDVTAVFVDKPGIVANTALIFGVTAPDETVTAEPYALGTSWVELCPEHVGSKFTEYESGSHPVMEYVPLAPVIATPPPRRPSDDIADTQTPFRPPG